MFQINSTSRTPVYEQIVEQVEQFIRSGIFSVGDKMPSVRSLSVQLSINPNTIQKAYSELDHRGLISSVPGRGCFITEDALSILNANSIGKLDKFNALIMELAGAGISEKELLDCVHNAFSTNKKGE